MAPPRSTTTRPSATRRRRICSSSTRCTRTNTTISSRPILRPRTAWPRSAQWHCGASDLQAPAVNRYLAIVFRIPIVADGPGLGPKQAVVERGRSRATNAGWRESAPGLVCVFPEPACDIVYAARPALSPDQAGLEQWTDRRASMCSAGHCTRRTGYLRLSHNPAMTLSSVAG